MQNITANETVHSIAAALESAPPPGALYGPRTETWRQRVVKLTLMFSDVVLALVVWEVACIAHILWAPGYLSGIAVASIVPVAMVWIGLRASQGLYPGYGMDEAEELKRQTYALVATLAFAAIFALAFQVGDAISRFLLGIVFAGLLFLSPLMRHFVKRWMRRHDVWGKPVVILGTGEAGWLVEETLKREWKLGFRPTVLFEDHPEGRLTAVKGGGEGRPEDGILAEAIELNRNHRVDTLFIAMPHAPREYLAELVRLAGLHFHSVVIIPDLAGVTSSSVAAINFAGTVGIEVKHSLLDPTVLRAKRAIDLAATVVGGLLILPFFLLICGLVWIESRGQVFYSAHRMGRNDRAFACLKFKTMVPDAEAVLARVLEEDPEAREEYRKYHKLRNDPRVTRIGKILRKTSLDELPQLWNVLRGEMSLVGPRPYLPRESSEIGKTQGEILRVYPGITGPWQVGGRSNTSFYDRVQIDADYVRNWSIWLDLVLLVRTVRCVLLRTEAY